MKPKGAGLPALQEFSALNRHFRGFAPFKVTFSRFRGPGGEVPRAEGGRGEVNLPPIGALTRPTEGRRILDL